MTLPRISYYRTLNFKHPVRVGIGTSLRLFNDKDTLLSQQAISISGLRTFEGSELGFGSLLLALDTSIYQHKKFILNVFFDQFLPTSTISSNINAQGDIGDRYGMQMGFRYQGSLLENLNLFGDLGYAKYFGLENGNDDSLDSIYYFNELVYDTKSWINPSLGLIGQSIYSELDLHDLYLVPGLIFSFTKNRSLQARIATLIGLTEDSDNVKLQAGLFYTF